MSKPVFDMARVEATADFIAHELRHYLDQELSDHLEAGCPSYEKLTIVEQTLASLLALNLVQRQITLELGHFNRIDSGYFKRTRDEAA